MKREPKYRSDLIWIALGAVLAALLVLGVMCVGCASRRSVTFHLSPVTIQPTTNPAPVFLDLE